MFIQSILHSRMAQTTIIAIMTVFFFSSVASAQVAGCDPDIQSAMRSTADARVVVSNSIDDELFEQDDSVLALTCFNQAASLSSQIGGVFSGAFADEIAPVIEDGLAAVFDDFAAALGASSGTVDYSTTAVQVSNSISSFNCNGLQGLWDTLEGEGVTPNIPFVSFADLVNGTALPPGAAGDFALNWASSSAQEVFFKLDQDMHNLTNRMYSADPSLDYSTMQTNQYSPCQVLEQVGAIAPGTC